MMQWIEKDGQETNKKFAGFVADDDNSVVVL